MTNFGKTAHRALPALAIGCLLLMGASCDRPLIDGPQIRKAPDGFLFDANFSAARKVFTDRPPTDQRGYHTMGEDTFSSITMTEFPRAATYEDAEAAREYDRQKYGQDSEYGPIEATIVDKHPAWIWTKTNMYQGQVSSLEYIAVVSYEEHDATWTVEYSCRIPKLMDLDGMEETVKTFTVKWLE
jgi:hypothetical protein